MADGNEEPTVLSSSIPEEDVGNFATSARSSTNDVFVAPKAAVSQFLGKAGAYHPLDEDGGVLNLEVDEGVNIHRKTTAEYQFMHPVLQAIDEDRRRTFAGDICVWLAPTLILGVLVGSSFFLTFSYHTVLGGVVLNVVLSITFLSGVLAVWLRRGWSFFAYGALGMLSAILLLTTGIYLGKYLVLSSTGLIDSAMITLRQTAERYEDVIRGHASEAAGIIRGNLGGNHDVSTLLPPGPIEEYGEYWLWRVDTTFRCGTPVWGGTRDYKAWRDREAHALPENPPDVNQYAIEFAMSLINVGAFENFTKRSYAVWWALYPFTKWPLSYKECRLDVMQYSGFTSPTLEIKRKTFQDWKAAVLQSGLTREQFYECVYYLDNTSRVLVLDRFYLLWIVLLAVLPCFSICGMSCFCVPSVASWRAFGRIASNHGDNVKRGRRAGEAMEWEIEERRQETLRRGLGSADTMGDEA